MGIQAPAEVKYGLIHEAVRQDDSMLNISALCRIAGVSRSGYYAWLDAAPLRQSREETDSADYAFVKQAYEFRGFAFLQLQQMSWMPFAGSSVSRNNGHWKPVHSGIIPAILFLPTSLAATSTTRLCI